MSICPWSFVLSFLVLAGPRCLPAFGLLFQFRDVVLVEDGIKPFSLLLVIVFQEDKRLVAQWRDGRQVADGHQGHRDVGQAPGQVQAGQRSEQHHAAHQEAIGQHHGFALGDEADVCLAIIIIADDAAEREQQDRDGDENPAGATHLVRQGLLRQLDAVDRAVERHPTEQDDEGRAGTDDQRVRKDAERLDQPLLDGVRDVRRRRDVGRRAHAGLVAEQAALDALHDGRADAAARRRAPAEGALDNACEDLGQLLQVHRHDDQGQQDVAQRHDRDEPAADARDAVDAAKDDHQRQECEEEAHPCRVETEGRFPGGADRVALHRVEGEAKGDGDQDGEQDAHPTAPQALFHIIGRPADERLLAFLLIKLGQRRLDKRARRAQQGDQPHPEHGARPADGHGGRHARQVARADTARQ